MAGAPSNDDIDRATRLQRLRIEKARADKAEASLRKAGGKEGTSADSLDAWISSLGLALRNGAIGDGDDDRLAQVKRLAQVRHELARARLREQEAALREAILVPLAPVRSGLERGVGILRADLEDGCRKHPGMHRIVSRAFDRLAKTIDLSFGDAIDAAKAIVAKTPDAATGRAKRSRNAAPKAKRKK